MSEAANPTVQFKVPLRGATNPGTSRGVTTPGSFAAAPDVGGPLTYSSPDTPGMPAPSSKTAWDFLPQGWSVTDLGEIADPTGPGFDPAPAHPADATWVPTFGVGGGTAGSKSSFIDPAQLMVYVAGCVTSDFAGQVVSAHPHVVKHLVASKACVAAVAAGSACVEFNTAKPSRGKAHRLRVTFPGSRRTGLEHRDRPGHDEPHPTDLPTHAGGNAGPHVRLGASQGKVVEGRGPVR
jgi:hypothetical protein